MKSIWGFVWSAMLIFGGAAAGGIWLAFSVISLAGDYERFAVPGTQAITVTEPTKFNVFHEYNTTFKGRTFRSPPQPGNWSYTINKQGDDGEPVKLVFPSPGLSFTYTVGQRQGYLLLSFELPEAGTYEFTVGQQGNDSRVEVLALGEGGFARTVARIAPPCVMMAVLLPSGFVLGIVTLVRRQRAAQARAQRALPPRATPV